MTPRSIASVSLLAFVVALWPVRGVTGAVAIEVVQDRVYRVGVYLVVDALVENRSPGPVDRAEVSVEFYDFFDGLVSAEHTVLRPASLGPGQAATLRAVTPYSDAVRKIRYRFTCLRGGRS